jgi:hypothetical protein
MDTLKPSEPNTPEQPGHALPAHSDKDEPQTATSHGRSTPRARTEFTTTTASSAAALALTAVLIPTRHSATDRTDNRPTAHPAPATYKITGSGSAQIACTQPRTTTTITAQQPCHHTTELAPGHNPAAISITPGPRGSSITRTLTIHGKPIQHATAYGRATCTTEPQHAT